MFLLAHVKLTTPNPITPIPRANIRLRLNAAVAADVSRRCHSGFHNLEPRLRFLGTVSSNAFKLFRNLTNWSNLSTTLVVDGPKSPNDPAVGEPSGVDESGNVFPYTHETILERLDGSINRSQLSNKSDRFNDRIVPANALTECQGKSSQ